MNTIRIISKVRFNCNKTRSFCLITILITNQTKPLYIDLACFDCCAKPRLPSIVWQKLNTTELGSELIEMECQQMRSNENEIITNLNGFFVVPFTMTIKTIVISNQECYELCDEWNAFFKIPGSGSGLDKHSDRNQQSWVFLNYLKNTLSLTERPPPKKKKLFEKQSPKNTLKNLAKVKHDMIIMDWSTRCIKLHSKILLKYKTLKNTAFI